MACNFDRGIAAHVHEEKSKRATNRVKEFAGAQEKHELHGHHRVNEQYPVVDRSMQGEGDGNFDPEPRHGEHQQQNKQPDVGGSGCGRASSVAAKATNDGKQHTGKQ